MNAEGEMDREVDGMVSNENTLGNRCIKYVAS